MTIDEMIAVLMAAKAGKVVEYRSKVHSATAWRYDGVDHVFNFGIYDYRVKPEPREGWVSPLWLASDPSTSSFIKVREVLE